MGADNYDAESSCGDWLAEPESENDTIGGYRGINQGCLGRAIRIRTRALVHIRNVTHSASRACRGKANRPSGTGAPGHGVRVETRPSQHIWLYCCTGPRIDMFCFKELADSGSPCPACRASGRARPTSTELKEGAMPRLQWQPSPRATLLQRAHEAVCAAGHESEQDGR